MRKTNVRIMAAFVGTMMLGSCLCTACNKKQAANDETPTITPTLEATVVPTSEPTEEPAIGATEEPTQEETPTREPEENVTPTPGSDDIQIKNNSYSYEVNDEDDQSVTLAYLSMDDIVVTVPDNEAASKKINDFLQQGKKEFVDMTEQLAEQAKNEYDCTDEENREYWCCYSIDSSYYTERSDKHCFSLLRNTSYEEGGPHPNNECIVYNFNPETGEILKLEDIIEDMPAFRELVNDKIRTYCKELDQEMIAEGSCDEGETVLLPEYEENIPKILQDGYWYFNDKGLDLIVNEYMITPHSYGTQDIEIPYSELKYVKEAFLK